MINPCKPNCLKYPMCISIKSIRCSALNRYFNEIVKDEIDGAAVWNHIRTFLPNAYTISSYEHATYQRSME